MIFGYVRVVCFNIAANNQMGRVFSLYLRSILRQDIFWFDEKRTGEYAINSMNGLNNFKNGVDRNVADILTIAVSYIAGCILAFVYGWQLTLFAVASVVPSLVGTIITVMVHAYCNY